MSAGGPAIDERALREEIGAFLGAQHVVSLAGIVAGQAHAACLIDALEGLSLYWTSDPDSRHSLAIERGPQVAATVAPDYTDFRFIRGVQIAGQARRLGEADAAHARDLLRGRFPFLKEPEAMPDALRAALDGTAYYRLDPDAVTWIDNTRGFGTRHTLRLL